MKQILLVFALMGWAVFGYSQEVVKIVASTNSGKNLLQVFTTSGMEETVFKKNEEFNQVLLGKLEELEKNNYQLKNFEVVVYPYLKSGAVTNQAYYTSREEIFYYWKY